MDSHTALWTEIVQLLRGMKELSAHAIESCGVKVELAGAHVLARVAELGPVRLTELASVMGLDPSSVSRQVSALEKQGWVGREDDPSDRRANRLTVTPTGRAVVAEFSAARTRALARLVPDWDTTDLDALTDRLARLNHDLARNRAQLGARLENA